MGTLSSIIGYPLGLIMYGMYSLVNDYGIALILFTILTKLLLSPLSINNNKMSAKQRAVAPQLEKLRKSYANNPTKLQEEQMKLYNENNINPMAGCLPLLIQLPIVYGILDVVYRPLTHILRLPKDFINQATEVLKVYLEDAALTADAKALVSRPELIILKYVRENPRIFESVDGFVDKVAGFNNTLFNGLIDLGVTPTLTPEVWNAQSIALFLIPVASGVFQLLLTIYSQRKQKRENPEAAKMMGSMNIMLYTMPIVSVWFTFTFPAGVGFYWALSSVFSLVQVIVLDKLMTPAYIEKMLEKERKKAKNKKPGFMEKMMEQQKAMLEAQNVPSNMSKSELNEYQRQLINEARKRMADKYGDGN